MKNSYYTVALLLMLFLAGCKSTGVIHCPDISSLGSQHTITWAKNSTKNVELMHHSKTTAAQLPSPAKELTASSDDNIHIKIKMPSFISSRLTTEDEFDGMNKLLGNYSGNKVSLQHNKKGKIFLAANSIKDVLNLSRNLSAQKPSAPIDDDAYSRMALAGGILGIIGLVFSLGPWIGYGSFLISVAAIVLGVFGLRSWRKGWALTGIILGALAILIAAALSGVFIVVLHV